MEVPLDGAYGAIQGFGQGLHLGPAQATLIVGVVGEGTICRDCLGGDSGVGEGLYLRDTGESGLRRHYRPPCGRAAGALMIRFTKAADGVDLWSGLSAAFSMLFLLVRTLHTHPRASPLLETRRQLGQVLPVPCSLPHVTWCYILLNTEARRPLCK